MKCNIGDVVIDRTYHKCGEVGVVAGTGILEPIILHPRSDGTWADYFSTWEKIEIIGHVDLEPAWKQVEEIKRAYLKGIEDGVMGATIE